eukprot:COSAG02_NODE_6983_length_3248_cov_209.588441_2_plen_261_part_00
MTLNAMWALLAAHNFVSNMFVNGLAQAHGDSSTQDVGTASTTIVSHTRAGKHGDGPLGRSMQEVPCGPCSNGGSCLGNMSTCTCPDGYGGHGCGVDYTTCAHMAKSASSLTDATEIRVALQTFDARERNVVEAATREVRRFNCSAWIVLEWRGEANVRRSLSNLESTAIHVPTHKSVSLSLMLRDCGGQDGGRGGAMYVVEGQIEILGSAFSNNFVVSAVVSTTTTVSRVYTIEQHELLLNNDGLLVCVWDWRGLGRCTA